MTAGFGRTLAIAAMLMVAGLGVAAAQQNQKKEMTYGGKKLLELALQQNGGEEGWCKRAKEGGKNWAPEEAKRLIQLLVSRQELDKPDAGPAIKQIIQYTQRHCAEKPMAEDEVRKLLIGNTIRVKSPANGKTLFIYFADGGKVLMNSPEKPARIVRKKWFFNQQGGFCRTVGKQNKNHCMGVMKGAADGSLKFNNKKSNTSYEATLLQGKQLAK